VALKPDTVFVTEGRRLSKCLLEREIFRNVALREKLGCRFESDEGGGSEPTPPSTSRPYLFRTGIFDFLCSLERLGVLGCWLVRGMVRSVWGTSLCCHVCRLSTCNSSMELSGGSSVLSSEVGRTISSMLGGRPILSNKRTLSLTGDDPADSATSLPNIPGVPLAVSSADWSRQGAYSCLCVEPRDVVPRGIRLSRDELWSMLVRVLAAIVVGTIIGRLGLDFRDLLSPLALQCWR
jgi:hypothetical protein